MNIDREPSIVIQLLPSDLKKNHRETAIVREEGETPNDRNDRGISFLNFLMFLNCRQIS